MKKKIYVAGPYSKGDVAQNVRKAILACNELLALGYTPYCPHLTHFWHFLCPQVYSVWLDYDNEWLPLCDALLRLDGESSGSDKETALAHKLGIRVFYSIDSLHNNLGAENPPKKIVINGTVITMNDEKTLTHADVVCWTMDELPSECECIDDYSVIYRMSRNHTTGRILSPGASISIRDGMVFNVDLTNQA